MYKNIWATEALSWCSALKVIYEDYCCVILECSYCAPQKVMILHHLCINHSSMKSKLDSYRHSVYLLTIFLEVACHYYKITVDATVFSLTVPDLKTALNEYNWLQKAPNVYSAHIADDTHSELWNITTDYTAHFTSLDMLEQSDLASISEDKSLSLQLIHDSCDIMICHWHNNALSQTDLM